MPNNTQHSQTASGNAVLFHFHTNTKILILTGKLKGVSSVIRISVSQVLDGPMNGILFDKAIEI